MKKIWNLRAELVFLMMVSLLIPFIFAVVIRSHGIGLRENSQKVRLKNVRTQAVDDLESELRSCDFYDTQQVKQMIAQKYKFLVGYNFYLVNQEGKVLTGTNSDITQIDVKKIYDGMQEYIASKEDKNVFRVNGCDALDTSHYLYYTYLKYDTDDMGMILVVALGAVVLFFCLIWRRISYISTIRASVSKIAQGDLQERIELRYQNELKDLAVDINQMAETLENEEKKKNDFMTNISHDIRTPLTTLLGYLGMIQGGKYDSEEQKQQYLDIMERKGKFLSSMLEDFFFYSKLASDDVKLEEISFEMNELLRQFYEDEETEFQAKGLTLKIDLYKEELPYYGEPELFARVVSNLLSNTLKYSKKNTEIIMESFVRKLDGENYMGFSVRNIPKQEIPEEQLKQLFERLYKRDQARKEEGSGLGLAIVNNIVRHYGGQTKAYMDGQYLVFECLLLESGKHTYPKKRIRNEILQSCQKKK